MMGQKIRAGARNVLGKSVEVHWQVSIALIVAAPLVAFTISRIESTGWVVTLLVVQLLIAAASWSVGEARAASLKDERLKSRGETLLTLVDGLDPLLGELARVAAIRTKPERKVERSGLVQLVLIAAIALGDDGSRPRASYFRLDDASTVRRMRHERSTGRSVAAKAEFPDTSVAGRTALAMIDAGRELFCDDLDDWQPPGWEPSKRGEYRTFISASVRAGGQAYGMLTVDATRVGALTVEDVAVMRSLGHILGIVERITA